jgi:LacI family transcriptional regulator
MNLRYLARLADLSPSAVSLALRNSPKISVATRKRVQELAEKTGYRPDSKIVAMMKQLRTPRAVRQAACFGLISFYDHPRPWENSLHHTRIFQGMARRAAELGYRLEPIWLREPGMTYRRVRDILAARGIEGLLSFGSPDFAQEFPPELGHCACVTVGLSVSTPQHRVTSHFYSDTVNALNRVHRLGYRRPGLILGTYEDDRSALAHSSAFLGWCEHHREIREAPPILRLPAMEPKPVLEWLAAHQPDAILFVNLPDTLPQLRSLLAAQPRRVPTELGVAVLSHVVEGTGFSGLQQNQRLMGAWAVELLAARIANRDLGIPANPRIEMVEGEWIDGGSLCSLGQSQQLSPH